MKKQRQRQQSNGDSHEPGTRQRLIQVAGQVFAEKGFDRATGKEIAELTGTNTAAVNYYFGGIEGLYATVFEEAVGRFVTSDALRAAVTGKTDAQTKLEALFGLIVQSLTSPESASWMLRLIGREFTSPTLTSDTPWEKEQHQRARLLKEIVSELLELTEDHPAVSRGCISVIAPCLMLLICDRSRLERTFPQLGLDQQDAPDLVRHMVQFSLAGLASLAADVRRDS